MLISLSGKARSGKDTFAEMLIKELSKTTREAYIMMAFAHELKVRCQRDFDLSYEQLWGDEKEDSDKRYPKFMPFAYKKEDRPKYLSDGSRVEEWWTAREIMQAYGQFYREIDSQFWVKNLFRVIEENEYKNVIITDVRHINEVDAVCDRGGYHIRILRENTDEIHGMQHISETALDDCKRVDFTVINDQGLKELQEKAADVTRYLIDSETEVSKL